MPVDREGPLVKKEPLILTIELITNNKTSNPKTVAIIKPPSHPLNPAAAHPLAINPKIATKTDKIAIMPKISARVALPGPVA